MEYVKRVSIAFLCFFCVLFSVTFVTADEKPVMLFFYSKDCDDCHAIMEQYLPSFLKMYGKYISFIEREVSIPAHFDSLCALESRTGVPEAEKDFPAVYFMGTMVEGANNVRMKLEYLVREYLAHPDSVKKREREVMSHGTSMIQSSDIQTQHTVAVAYFYKRDCKECSRAEEIIEWLKKKYAFVSIDVFDISDARNKLIASYLGIKTGMPEKRLMSTPVFFFGDREYMLSENITRENLSRLIEKFAPVGTEPVWRTISNEELKAAEETVSGVFRKFSFLTVALAGFGDGINPCAFATILFFISYLGILGRTKREILFVGLSFALAVFITYFCIGLGFLSVVKRVVHIELLSKIIFGGTAVLCAVFGFLSVVDYFKARSGNISGMSLQLPTFLKRSIHATIRDKAKTKSYIVGAFVAGFIVSVLEFACTGQVYLPTITFMIGVAGQKSKAISHLLIYNICFIFPLLIVFGAVYGGVSSKAINRLMEAKVGMVKLILAAVFFAVGGLLFWTVFM
jgi:thiol-disulfide isomerase/thioredoxin